MTTLRAAALVVALALVACDTASAEQLACATTARMAQQVERDGSIDASTVEQFLAVAPDVQDPDLQPLVARAAADLTVDPSQALDALGDVFERCGQLGLSPA